MAKYDWKQLEKEYILSDYKSVSAFLKGKEIKNNGTTRKYTSGWKNKKRQKEDEKATKVVEKTIEKESEKESSQIVQIKDVANDLLTKIVKANEELNMHLTRNKKKLRAIKYDTRTNKPSKEIVQEEEEIKSYIDIIDRKGLKELTSALKDLNDILNNKSNDDNSTQSLAEIVQKAYESKAGDKQC